MNILILLGMDQGQIEVYYHPPQLEAQPHIVKGMTVTLGKILFRPGEAFVIKLF